MNLMNSEEYDTIKLYEVQYESIPSVGLTIYVILVRLTDESVAKSTSTALQASIITSLMSITYSTLRIFIKNINKNTFAIIETNINNDKIAKKKKKKKKLELNKIRCLSSIERKFASQMHTDTPENSTQLQPQNTTTQSVELVVKNLNNGGIGSDNDNKNDDDNFVHFSPSTMNDISDTSIIFDEKCNSDTDHDNIIVDDVKWSSSDSVNARAKLEYFFKFENLFFVYFILYFFVLTDFYCRVFPNLILFCLFRSIDFSYLILCLLITMSILTIFAMEYILSKWIRIHNANDNDRDSNLNINDNDNDNHDNTDDKNKNKDVLYYLFVLYFSSLVNVLFSLPMKRFNLKIDLKKFLFAQMIRLLTGLIIEMIVLSANKIEILFLLHGLYACSLICNVIICWLIHKAKYPHASIFDNCNCNGKGYDWCMKC